MNKHHYNILIIPQGVLTSSRVATAFLQWDIRVVKLEVVGAL